MPEPQASEQDGLGGGRPHHAPQAEFTAVLGGEHDVRALNTAQLLKNRARALAQAGAPLPLLQGLPQDVGQKADQDVRTFGLVKPAVFSRSDLAELFATYCRITGQASFP